MMIRPVDQRDANGLAAKRPRRCESAETAAENDDVWTVVR